MSLSPSPAGAPRNHSVGLSCPAWQREARTHVCVDVYVASHVWTGPCGHGVRAWQLQVCMCEPPGVCCVQKARVPTWTHARSWPRRPHGCLPSCPAALGRGKQVGLASASFPREEARPRWEAEAMPECWPGAVPGFVLPVRPMVATSDGRLAPIRKALPRSGGQLAPRSSRASPLTSPAAPAASLPGASPSSRPWPGQAWTRLCPLHLPG